MGEVHLEISSKNIDSSVSLMSLLLQSLASEASAPIRTSPLPDNHPLMVFYSSVDPRQTGGTHLTALNTTPTPAFGVSVFSLSDIVFASHKNLWLHCCKCPPLSLMLSFHFPSALHTPSSLFFFHQVCSLMHFLFFPSSFFYHSHPCHCCSMALERNYNTASSLAPPHRILMILVMKRNQGGGKDGQLNCNLQ